MRQAVIQKAEEKQRRQQPNLTGIPTQMKLDFEQRSGLSFDDVRVHYNSDKPRKIGALAYTQGTQVHIGPGQERHLRHELGHVVQQKQGIVRPDRESTLGTPINTDPLLERQADLWGDGILTSGETAGISQPHQAKAFGGPVLQAKHVFESIAEAMRYFECGKPPGVVRELKEVSTKPPCIKGAAEKAGSENPTMVYESMGVDSKAFSQILAQTKRYNGNTLLVFGLNMNCSGKDGKTISSSFGTDLASFASEYDKIVAIISGENAIIDSTLGSVSHTAPDTSTTSPVPHIHSAYCFPFWWRQPLSTKGYLMPFIEARKLIINKAQDYIGKNDSSFNLEATLFRWIDGDACNDQMQLDGSFLNQLAQEPRPFIVTGAYHWRSINPRPDPKYAEFIAALNTAECTLRELFYKIKCAESPKLPEKMVRFNLSSNDHDTYYFPETALIMNNSAHDCLSDVNVSDGNEESQDQESMKMVKDAAKRMGKDAGLLVIPAISVFKISKPIKNEGGARSYLGDDLQKIISREKPEYTFIEFCSALKNLRQSVFNNRHWHFRDFSDDARWETFTGEIEGEFPSDIWKQSKLNKARYEEAKKLARYELFRESIKGIP